MPDWGQGMVASLNLETPDGPMRIHNVYNKKQAGTTAFFEQLTLHCCGDNDILIGDFNLHHELWSGPSIERKKVSLAAKILAGRTQEADMMMCVKPGAATYTKSKNNSYESTLDLVFVGKAWCSPEPVWSVLKVPGFDECDHRVCETWIDATPRVDVNIFRLWNQTDVKEYRAGAKNLTERVRLMPLQTRTEIDRSLAAFVSGLEDVIQQCVPSRDSYQHEPPKPTPHPNATATPRLWGIWQTARWPKNRSKPVVQSFTPNFEWEGKKASTAEAKADMFGESIYGPGKLSRLEAVDPLPVETYEAPHTSLDETDFHFCEEGEVGRLISSLPKRKSSGSDGIANEALKMAKDIITPYLEAFFKACGQLGYFPKYLKKSKSILFFKEGKEANDPKAYRPIALLSSIGKLFEKMIADRLIKIHKSYRSNDPRNPLPLMQFGGLPGRSTTLALQAVTCFVQNTWRLEKLNRREKRYLRRFASILGLDISGAYPRVDRDALIKALVSKGIPLYMVRCIHSFLCDRTTTLLIPGHGPQEFFENGGLPQGSCLSPILFLIFAAPLLEPLEGFDEFQVQFLAFVDDTYILVASKSHKENCKILEIAHRRLIDWAEAHSVKFGPEKYGLMHFLPPKGRNANQPQVKERPCIEGLPPNKILFKENWLKILGVKVDHTLSWKKDVEDIKEKAEKAKQRLQWTSSSVRGHNLVGMRRMYLAMVQSILTYAAPVWGFRPRVETSCPQINANLLHELDKWQQQCLRFIAGAFKSTPRMVIYKELFVHKLSDVLYYKALEHYALNVSSVHMTIFHGDPQDGDKGALYAVAAEAQKLLDPARKRFEKRHDPKKKPGAWEDSKYAEDRKRAIKKEAKKQLNDCSAAAWKAYQAEFKSDFNLYNFALNGDWGPENLERYKKLNRKQCTILLQCRTGFIGLQKYLSMRKLVSLPRCRRGCSADETVKHMFERCRDPTLVEARIKLQSETGESDTGLLLENHPVQAANFAIEYFNLDQFSGKKPPPTSQPS